MYKSLKNLQEAKNNLFINSLPTESEFGDELGILVGEALRNNEISRCKELIVEKIKKNLEKKDFYLDNEISAKNLEQYHEYIDDEAQKICLSKLGRILDKEAVEEIKSFSFFQKLEDKIGKFKISDEENIGHEQVHFRLVRPNKQKDVGYLHRDSWFWDYHKFNCPSGYSRFKVWFSICGDPESSGLLFVPSSHNSNLGYKIIEEENKLKFETDKNVSEHDLYRFCDKHGTPVMFNHNILHVGSINKSLKTRGSMELTVLYKS